MESQPRSTVAEAKEWAGQMLSGQTVTGRIMVCPIIFFCNYLDNRHLFVSAMSGFYIITFIFTDLRH